MNKASKAMVPLVTLGLGCVAILCSSSPAQEQGAETIKVELIGFPELPVPQDNPLTNETFELGKRLFFDPILSADRKISCASCHQPEHGFASPEPRPLGVYGRRALRHAPTLYNRGYGKRQRWDGLAGSLEEQVLLPIEDPNEMDLKIEDAVTRLAAEPSYREAFAASY
ncbi:MAG: cytochrome-c peroxidase, partial [Planctomycetota bacterium]